MIERSFRVDESVYEMLKEISDVEHVTVSFLVRLAISKFIDAYMGDISIIDAD